MDGGDTIHGEGDSASGTGRRFSEAFLRPTIA
jgi:hypothetical protein